jgi:predicted Zn-dependent peptidase
MKDTDTVALDIWVKTGSRDETAEQNGISHFLEHMAFKGTDRRSAKDIAESFDNIGGFLNASTSREHTVYYAKVLKQNTDIAIDVLADILQHSVFDKKELERERGVILQEVAMTLDTPDDIIFDYFQETAYKDQALGRPVLGSNANISSFTSEDMNNFMGTHYSVDDILFSVAGNIEHNQVIDLANKHFTSLKSYQRPIKQPASYTGGSYVQSRDLEQVHLVLGFEGVSYLSSDLYAIQILSILLGGGMSSRLFQEVREKRGLAYTVYSFNSTFLETGTFGIYASTDPNDVAELVNVISSVLTETAHSITEEELQRAKTQASSSLLMGYESSSFRADEMGRNMSCLGRHLTKKEILQHIDDVSQKDLVRLLMQIPQQSNLTISALGKIDKLADYDVIAQKFKA